MTPVDLQDRSKYLSLALFSQRVVSALVDYVDEDKVKRLRPSLIEALEALRRSRSRASLRVTPRGGLLLSLTMNSYELSMLLGPKRSAIELLK